MSEAEAVVQPSSSAATRLAAIRIIYTNEELVVIDKPHNVAMDGDAHDGATVEKWVHDPKGPLAEFMGRPLPTNNQATSKGNGNQGPTQKQLKHVHQLDYATSGLLCLAFSRLMASQVAHCFEMRYTRKEYLALLVGWVPQEKLTEAALGVPPGLVRDTTFDSAASSMTIDAAIGYDEEDPNNFKMKVDGKNARASRTQLMPLQYGFLKNPDTEGEKLPVTKVLLHPASGRRHQLRVHCASIGHPIVGDHSYCDVEPYGSTNGVDRLMLHAYCIAFNEKFDADETSHLDRVQAKRKRRRETRGFEEHESKEKTVFTTSRDPIEDYMVPKAEASA